VTNALNLQLLTEISESLKKVSKDPHVHGIVLSSSNDKFFSIGYDIRALYNTSKEEFTQFYHTFNRLCLDLYTVSKPIVAAITGHAIAGGCALTLCCDYRFIAEGRKLMGFNVVKMGIPVPYLVNCILQDMVGSRVFREIADTGEFFPPEKLLSMGMVDCVLPLKDVVTHSIEKAHSLGALPQRAFAITKRNRVERVVQHVLSHLAEKEQLFVECWFSDETRERLKAAMEKF
jgi:3,2-trans-enoyl-CoA isomerase